MLFFSLLISTVVVHAAFVDQNYPLQVHRLAIDAFHTSNDTLEPSVCAAVSQGDRRWVQCWSLQSGKASRVVPVDGEMQRQAKILPFYDRCAFADLAPNTGRLPLCVRALREQYHFLDDRYTGRVFEENRVLKVFSTTRLQSNGGEPSFESERLCVVHQKNGSDEVELFCANEYSDDEVKFDLTQPYQENYRLSKNIAIGIGEYFLAGIFENRDDAQRRMFLWGSDLLGSEEVSESRYDKHEFFGKEDLELHAGSNSLCFYLRDSQHMYCLARDFRDSQERAFLSVGGRMDGVQLPTVGGEHLCYVQAGSIKCERFVVEESKNPEDTRRNSEHRRVFELSLGDVSFDSWDLAEQMQAEAMTLDYFFSSLDKRTSDSQGDFFSALAALARKRVASRTDAHFLLEATKMFFLGEDLSRVFERAFSWFPQAMENFRSSSLPFSKRQKTALDELYDYQHRNIGGDLSNFSYDEGRVEISLALLSTILGHSAREMTRSEESETRDRAQRLKVVIDGILLQAPDLPRLSEIMEQIDEESFQVLSEIAESGTFGVRGRAGLEVLKYLRAVSGR